MSKGERIKILDGHSLGLKKKENERERKKKSRTEEKGK